MKARVKTKLGQAVYEFDIEEREEMETLHKAIVLANPRTKCDNCENVGYDDKRFSSNKDKEGNVYVNVKCVKCGATSKLGRYKAGGFFWHSYELYQPKGNQDSEDIPGPSDDDI